MLGQRYISWIFLICGVFTFQKDSTTHTSAAMLGNSSGTASNSTTATKTTTDTPNSSIDNDIIIGVSVGGVLLFLLILCITIYCCLRHKRYREKSGKSASNGPQLNCLDGSVSRESKFTAYDNNVYNSENNSMHTSF